uniref:Uncharacterized protein n=1 Tax=Leersia perrieri TaxID=77586 RepID=A0A0D9VW74_9ORYZ
MLPLPQRRLVLHFVLLTAAASISTPIELTVASHPLSPVRLPPAAPFAGEGGGSGGPFCTRVHVRGRPSRLRDPSRFFHALRVRANATRPAGLELCFHRNATVGPCKCAASQWHKMPKSGLWVQAISPYDTRILDFRMPSDPSRSVLVSTEEEFLLHRVVFLLLGMVLMAVAHTLSESVVFYYGGAMTIGIFLVILIILFQGMKLLPTGRKSSLAIFVYSSLLGIFLLVSVILAGAWFGYWGVRKLVLTEEGSVDAGVAYFVEWAILIISAVMILQSSLDYLVAFSALVFCTVTKAVSRIEGKSRFLWCLSRGFSNGIMIDRTSYEDLGEEYSSINGSHQDGRFSKLHGEHRRYTPKRNSPGTGQRKTLSQGLATDSYYSTFHTNPERRKFSEEEYEAFTREETNKAMKQLISSPDFNRWALANVDRISVTPQRTRPNSSNQQRRRLFGLF